MLVLHLLVDAVEVLGSAVGLVFNADFIQRLADFFHDIVDGALTLALSLADLFCQIVVSGRFQEFQSDVFQFHLHRVDTESGSQRRVDIQRLLTLLDDLLMGHVVDRSEIVKSVRQFDDEHPDVL